MPTVPARSFFLTIRSQGAPQAVPGPGNVDKTMAAPVTSSIAWDTNSTSIFPSSFPQADIRSYFVGNKPLSRKTPRNGSLQAAYFILAARAWDWTAAPCPASDAGN